MPRPLAYLTVFVSSACVMVVELVAGRLVAPALGVSLYTWTTVVGVILGGIGLGNYLGGHLAD
ncbi:MAG: fused MFS/spermidine synthase, partial [Chloroflexi bacterium]|nr:fused MFS/spermidine synthase [Chloroflexota bacterium]